MSYTVVHWDDKNPPTRESIERRFAAEGLQPSSWSNGPGDKYAEHSHSYNKVLFCLSGSITFKIAGNEVELHAGDRLDLSPGTPHSAVVGSNGVVCLEASR